MCQKHQWILYREWWNGTQIIKIYNDGKVQFFSTVNKKTEKWLSSKIVKYWHNSITVVMVTG